MKKWEHFTKEDTFRPIDMFPEWKKSINRDLPIWNFSEENFYKEVNVYIFIVGALTKWCNEDIMKKWYNYFWWKVIIEAFNIYWNRVSYEYSNYIKDLVNNFLEKEKNEPKRPNNK
jgi:hypothetical protein